VRQLARLRSLVCRPFGAQIFFTRRNPGLTPGATVFRPLRGLFNDVSREHAFLLSGACFAILLFIFPATQSRWVPIGWTNHNSNRDEIRLDGQLQEAANAALAGREGTIIIMDARTGRVRALVNPDGAYRQALMPGSAMKPFTALAGLRAGLIDENSRTVCPG